MSEVDEYNNYFLFYHTMTILTYNKSNIYNSLTFSLFNVLKLFIIKN